MPLKSCSRVSGMRQKASFSMNFLHKTGRMCNDFLWMGRRCCRTQNVTLLASRAFRLHSDTPHHHTHMPHEIPSKPYFSFFPMHVKIIFLLTLHYRHKTSRISCSKTNIQNHDSYSILSKQEAYLLPHGSMRLFMHLSPRTKHTHPQDRRHHAEMAPKRDRQHHL